MQFLHIHSHFISYALFQTLYSANTFACRVLSCLKRSHLSRQPGMKKAGYAFIHKDEYLLEISPCGRLLKKEILNSFYISNLIIAFHVEKELIFFTQNTYTRRHGPHPTSYQLIVNQVEAICIAFEAVKVTSESGTAIFRSVLGDAYRCIIFASHFFYIKCRNQTSHVENFSGFPFAAAK